MCAQCTHLSTHNCETIVDANRFLVERIYDNYYIIVFVVIIIIFIVSSSATLYATFAWSSHFILILE